MSRRRTFSSAILVLVFSLIGQAKAGYLYVARDNGTITRIDTSTRVESIFASGLGNPGAMAFDTSGNLFVNNNNGGGEIDKITPAGVVSVFIKGFGLPGGMAFDASGNLFVSNGSLAIEKITPGGVASVFTNQVSGGSYGLAFDASGNLYVAAQGVNSIEKFTTGGVGSLFFQGGGFFYPSDLAFDASGNLFAANILGTIAKITPAGVGTNFANNPFGITTRGLALDSAGNVYAATNNANGGAGIEVYTPPAASVACSSRGRRAIPPSWPSSRRPSPSRRAS